MDASMHERTGQKQYASGHTMSGRGIKRCRSKTKEDVDTDGCNKVSSDIVIESPRLMSELCFTSRLHWCYWRMVTSIVSLLWSLHASPQDVSNLLTPVRTSKLLLQYTADVHQQQQMSTVQSQIS